MKTEKMNLADEASNTSHAKNIQKLTDTKQQEILSQQERQFILETCSGIVEHSSLLTDCINLLFAENSNINPSLKTNYKIFFFFLIFRLNQDNFKKLKLILQTQNPSNILAFLRLVYEKSTFHFEQTFQADTKLSQTVKPVTHLSNFYPELRNVLERYFDEKFIVEHLTKSIIDFNYENAIEFVVQLSSAFEQTDRKPQQLPTTSFSEFHLKPQSGDIISQKQIIENNVQALELDYNIYKKSLDEVQNERIQQIMNTRQSTTVTDESMTRFALPKKRLDLPLINENLPPKKPKKIITNNPQPVKQTKAQLLREDQLLQKKMKEEADQLELYSAGLHDSYEFDNWKRAMDMKDQLIKQQEVENRKVMAQKLLEDAKQAQKLAQNMKKAVVAEQNLEKMEEMIEFYENQEQEEAARAEKIRMQQEENQLALEKAKKDLLEQKKAEVNQAKSTNQDMLQNAKELSEIQQMEKVDLVKQIKAFLEVAAADRFIKLAEKYDPSETMNIGLLNEMSLTELRERLGKMKEYQIVMLENKKNRIQAEKEEEARALQEKQDRLNIVKQALAQARKANNITNDSSIFQRVAEQVSSWAEEVKISFEKQIYQKESRRNMELQQAKTMSNVANEKLDALKERMKQLKEKKSTINAFRANEHIQTKRLPSAKTMEQTARQTDLTNKMSVKDKQIQERENAIKSRDKAVLERKRQTDYEMEQEIIEKKRLVEDAKRNREVQQRKLALENPYKAKASGYDVGEIYL
ncbi:hypothetical protein SS50377_22076 [Spironucleus salmonicida]|nr:hypothetical protein SS50377_22076 [Spironucleus salmonicida]